MKDFYKGKKILITGHTGFKGSWMSYILYLLGAKVIGVSLEPNTKPNLYTILNLQDKVDSRICDIRDINGLNSIFEEVKPELVFHLAAQPLVLNSYSDPVYTYDVNVMGTVNICECVRKAKSVKSFINVTTDKVYQNEEWYYGYRENDRLNGYDPYSNSKSCSELVTHSYISSFFKDMKLPVSTCRAGNVIGGGDFNENRIIPDCVKYTNEKKIISVRNPNSTRPYQHVLEPVIFYLYLAKLQHADYAYASQYNIGPNESDCLTTGDIVTLFCKEWGDGSNWNCIDISGPHEANFLKLDCSKAKSVLNWKPIWNVEKAVRETVLWSKCFYQNEDIEDLTKNQILEYLEEMEYKWKV
ncbi:CDP-glucose 4,6-dehydratase [Erysipelotrichaceae bacterium AF15-26LB]|nr:CDP-glucose 4,6-dehydratase [Erysipelotrichaceae bacterium AF15-26LB]RJV85004.1 CDP-glucose 4,6-dehydratase [Erysipelotrichaceae bacterium AF19-24AC]